MKIEIDSRQLNIILSALTLYSDSIPTRKKQMITDYNMAYISQQQLEGNLEFLNRIREQIEELKDAIIEDAIEY